MKTLKVGKEIENLKLLKPYQKYKIITAIRKNNDTEIGCIYPDGKFDSTGCMINLATSNRAGININYNMDGIIFDSSNNEGINTTLDNPNKKDNQLCPHCHTYCYGDCKA